MNKHNAIKTIVFGALSLGSAAILTNADPTQGTVYYTRYNSFQRVNSVDYKYDGTTFSISNNQFLSTLPGADGIIFAPDGDLLVGGQGNAVYKVKPDGSSFTGVNAGGTSSFHLSPDPSQKNIWSGGIPGQLAEIPLTPFSAGIAYRMAGDETGVDSIIFRGNSAYYTSSFPNGNGSFGEVTFDRVTHVATTHRLLSNVIAAHGGAYDSYTDSILLFGDEHITQLKGSSPSTILSDLFIPGASFDQGAVDGKGHTLVADPGHGNIFFLDYSTSGLVADPSNFHDAKFVAYDIDDVAPLSGIGSQNPVPEANTIFGFAGVVTLAAGNLLRRSRRQA